MTKPTDLVQGILDLLIMRTIAAKPIHGWAIAQRIQFLSKDVLQGIKDRSTPPCSGSSARDGSRPTGCF